MSYYYIYGVGAVVLVGAVSIVGGGQSNWQPARATISTIDRNCQIIETEYDGDYKRKSSRVYTDSCNSIDEWEKVKTKRKKDVAGTAVVHVDYTVAQTGRPQSGDLRFDGHDDEFYRLKAGDEIDILVSKSDPSKIRKV